MTEAVIRSAIKDTPCMLTYTIACNPLNFKRKIKTKLLLDNYLPFELSPADGKKAQKRGGV
jgi:hypothetical protein